MSLPAAMERAEREVEALALGVRRSTVELQAGSRAAGAGVAWGGDLVITNAHVALRDRLTVVRPDGETRAGRVLSRDPGRDLALVLVPRLDLDPISFGKSERLRPGMMVFALGHPLGVVGALSTGVVHAVGASFLLPAYGPRQHRWLQLDMAVAPGNSGGPVLDTGGEVVGLTTMIVHGLTLAVPSEEALRWAARRVGSCPPSTS
ncbi:MAG TPA: serine protease [Gemmatimonadales bacterium]|nr:serine protease [Gemmatimonadales bacterium]